MGFIQRHKAKRASRNKKNKESSSSNESSPRISKRKSSKLSRRKSSARKSCRAVPGYCLHIDDDASASQVDMVEIDLGTSPMHSKKTNSSATKNFYPNETSSKCSSMMTPDMLEVLGITEMHKAYSFHPERQLKKEIAEKPKKKENVASTSTPVRSSPAKKAVVLTSRRNSIEAAPQEEGYTLQDKQTTREGHNARREPTREGETTRERQTPREEKASKERKASKKKKSVRYTDTASCMFYGGNDEKSFTESIDTSSTCSSDGSYFEPIPQDPCDPCDVYYPCQDDWTFAEGYDCYYEREKKSSSKTRGDSFTIDSCDPLTVVGMVLTMPIACGLLCVDNVLDTNYFESASKALKNITSDKPISDKPEFLVIEDKRCRRRRKANNDLVA
eukprot:CAMPEP_0116155722 /NCGR_PEP_ID=MMETSP0329-20121206/22461_1 /TAXON_ID=697910 /ORGANISM="Pseudo-nitzschia arenysensis, Strain B593" /LENGTH=388 /DNA_ID=CAMNT_0003652779 /DNA_START=263 /DNA_END=1429 /DNA_ORIENTATION=+